MNVTRHTRFIDSPVFACDHGERKRSREHYVSHRLESFPARKVIAPKDVGPALKDDTDDGERDSHDGCQPINRCEWVGHAHLLLVHHELC